MKVIGINGSPRRNKNSRTMLEYALKGAESSGAAVEAVNLVDLNFSGCLSCFACKRIGGASFGKCALKDDLAEVLAKIFEADAVILSTPVYFGNVPGMVENLFERLWFPGLLYKRDGSTAYSKRIKTGLIYTMNVPDETMYETLIQTHKANFEHFFGETKVLCSTDTLQFDNYDLYTGDLFDGKHKMERHLSQFPRDCENAFAMGKSMIEEG